MIYYTRIFFILVIIVPYILYFVFKKKKMKIHRLIILFISLFIIALVPFESLYINFKTPNDSFNYSYVNRNIYKVIDNNSGSFVLYGRDCNISGYTYVSKNNKGGYNMVYPTTYVSEKEYISGEYKIDIETYKDNILVLVHRDSIKEPVKDNVIIDNKGSNYTYYYCKYQWQMNYTEGYYATIENIDDLQISINGTLLTLQ